MAFLDEKTTQAISKFTIDDVSVVTEKETLKIADADREMRAAYERLDSKNEPKEVTEQSIQVSVKKINETLSVLLKIGAFSKDFNAVILRGFASLIKSEPDLSDKTKEAIKTVSAKLIEIRDSLDNEVLTISAEDADNDVILGTLPNQEPEVKAETKVEPTALDDLKDELDELYNDTSKMKGKISALHERLKVIEKQSKLFLYCGLGIGVITLLSLVFSIIALAK